MAEGTGLENRHTGNGIESSNLSLSVLQPSETMVRQLGSAMVIVAALGACSSQQTAQNDRDTMTQRQKDSVLAQSQLPGARGVGNAIEAADSAKARQARLDSIANAP